MTPKAHTSNKRLDKFHFTNLQHYQKCKKKKKVVGPLEWENAFIDMGLIPRICKGFLKCNNKKANDLIKTKSKGLKQTFSSKIKIGH